MTRPDDPQSDEELPAARRRLRLDLLVGAGVLVAVLAVGKAISGGQHDRADATSSPSAPATAPTQQRTGVVVPPPPSSVVITHDNGERLIVPALPLRTASDLAACPGGLSCFRQQAVPGTVLDAVRAVFPRATVVSNTSVRLESDPWAGQVWFRQLNFRVQGSELLARVYAPGPDSEPAVSGTNQSGTIYYRTTVRQYVVALQIGAGAGGTAEKLRQLALDERLVAT